MTLRLRLIPLIGVLAMAIGCGGGQPDRPNGAGDEAQLEQRPAAVDDEPSAVRRYVAAVNDEDLEALVAAFHPDGEVIDVGRRIAGAAAIRRWAENEGIGGRLTVLRSREIAGGGAARALRPRRHGGFEANYAFEVAGDVPAVQRSTRVP